jgi:hypothetical protein
VRNLGVTAGLNLGYLGTLVHDSAVCSYGRAGIRSAQMMLAQSWMEMLGLRYAPVLPVGRCYCQ